MYVIVVYMVTYVIILQCSKSIKLQISIGWKILVYGAGKPLFVTFCNDRL